MPCGYLLRKPSLITSRRDIIFDFQLVLPQLNTETLGGLVSDSFLQSINFFIG
jgi:hypothetical protein